MAPLEAMPWAESKMQDVEAKPSEVKVGGTVSWMVTLSQQSNTEKPVPYLKGPAALFLTCGAMRGPCSVWIPAGRYGRATEVSPVDGGGGRGDRVHPRVVSRNEAIGGPMSCRMEVSLSYTHAHSLSYAYACMAMQVRLHDLRLLQ